MWPGFYSRVMCNTGKEKAHSRANQKRGRGQFPGAVPVGRCMFGFHLYFVAVGRVTAAHNYVRIQCFVGDHASATPSSRHCMLAAMPVEFQVVLPAMWQNFPAWGNKVNTSRDKGAELLRRIISVLFLKMGNTARCIFCRYDIAVLTQLLTK